MTRRGAMERMLHRYGTRAQVGEAEVRAIIRPMDSKSMPDDSGPAESYYRYTGLAGALPEPGGRIVTARGAYRVVRADITEFSGEEIYAWAVLKAESPGAVTEIYLEADGAIAARADECDAHAVQDSRVPSVWGEREPAFAAAGAVRYGLTLKGVRPQGGTDLSALAEFRVVLARPGGKTVYSGCRWKRMDTAQRPGGGAWGTLEAVAAKREERKEENDGSK